MYNSPIRIDYTYPIFQIRDQLNEKLDETVAKAVMAVNISVDRDEMVKALEYDRGQYDLGYRDGFQEGYKTAKQDAITHLTAYLEGMK